MLCSTIFDKTASALGHRPLLPAVIFSGCLAFSLGFGRPVYEQAGIFDHPLRLAVTVPVVFLVAFLAFQFIASKIEAWNLQSLKRANHLPPRFWLLAWLLTFLCWLPCLLAYWPGSFSYDMPSQTRQAVTGLYDAHHPPLHTFFWAICLHVGPLIGLEPMAVYALFQMLLLSYALSQLVRLLQECLMPTFVVMTSLAFVALHPLFAAMSIAPTKDVFFAAFLILFSLDIVRLAASPKGFLSSPGRTIRVLAMGLLCCLFRNNMPYALLLAAPFAALVSRQNRLAIAAIFAVPAITALVAVAPIMSALGVGPGTPSESLCVPIQQVAYVAVTSDEELDESLKHEIGKYMDYNKTREFFDPRFADPVKILFTSDTTKYGDFLRLWFEIGQHYPGAYLREFLNLNIHYWYLPASASRDVYVATGVYPSDYYTFEQTDAFPLFRMYYDAAITDKIAQKLPFTAPLFSVALPIWIVLAGICLLAAIKRKHYSLVYLAPLFVWVSYIFGPVALFRYIFPLICLYPLLVLCALRPRELFQELRRGDS